LFFRSLLLFTDFCADISINDSLLNPVFGDSPSPVIGAGS
jgi:hypothetical protein